jgi:HlyD family secretion protein
MPTSTSQSSPPAQSSQSTLQKPLRRSRRQRFGWSALLLVVLLGSGAFSLNLWEGTKKSQQKTITQPVERRTIPITITANGTVDAERSINLSPKSSGIIKKLLVKESDLVRKGQVIAVMDDANMRGDLTQYRGQLAQQEANLNKVLNGNRSEDIAQAQGKLKQVQAKLRQAEDDLQRNQDLFKEGAISQQTVNQKRSDRDSTEAEVNQAKAALNLQQRGSRPEDISTARAQVQSARGALQKIQVQLNDTRILAPFDGVVIKKYADVGAFVSPSMAGGNGDSASSSSILALSSQRHQVVVNLSESQIAKVKLGQAVTLTVDAFPGEVFTGKVDRVAPKATISQNVTSFEVYVALSSPSAEKLKEGMNVDAQFKVGRLENAMLIPNAAVVRKPEGEGVFILGPDRRPVFRSIKTGVTAGSQTAVKSGLKGNEQVLVSPPSTQSSGSKGFSLIPKAPPGQ